MVYYLQNYLARSGRIAVVVTTIAILFLLLVEVVLLPAAATKKNPRAYAALPQSALAFTVDPRPKPTAIPPIQNRSYLLGSIYRLTEDESDLNVHVNGFEADIIKELLERLEQNTNVAESIHVAWDPKGNLVSSSDNTIRTWTASGALLETKHYRYVIDDIAIDADGRQWVITGSSNGQGSSILVQSGDSRAWEKIAEYHSPISTDLLFSPGNKSPCSCR